MDFGERLKKIRVNAGMSARVLAEKVGVSASFIYQLERNEATPSFSTLKRIAGILRTSVSALTDEEFPEEWVVVRKAARRRLVTEHDGIEVNLLAFLGPRDKRMQGCIVVVQPGAVYPGEEFIYTHDRDDFIYVLEGTIEIESGGSRYQLERGDAGHFSLRNIERMRNPGKTPAEVLWLVSPAGE
ncbi:MAG: XRE family transcriptional regulator [Bacillota bacterium]